MPPPPVVLTLLAADRVARSRQDSRCDLTGVFHALVLPLPAHLTFAVYFVVTNCHVVGMLSKTDRQVSSIELHNPSLDDLYRSLAVSNAS